MNRRTIIASTAAAALIAPAAWAGAKTIDYTPCLIDAALAEGKTVFVDYAADWCSTCHRQERVIKVIREANPAYDDAMIFVRVVWDKYGQDDVAVFRNIPRRSTLIVLKGEDELGRIVAGTSESDIKALMDKGLAAAES
jgi:thiol-disulfide isomerase/thioredoxin